MASASLRDQLLLLSTHPSVLAFMLSSDELPPPDVEAMCARRSQHAQHHLSVSTASSDLKQVQQCDA